MEYIRKNITKIQYQGLKLFLNTSSEVSTVVALPGHPAELSDSVRLLLTDAKGCVFEIDFVLKSIC